MGFFTESPMERRDKGRVRKPRQNPPWLGRKLEKEQLSAARAPKPFVAWDGEGYDDENGDHHYMLFGCRRNLDDGYPDEFISGDSLSSSECLKFIWDRADETGSIHVAFGFGYDVDQITRDLPDERLRELVGSKHETNWDGYKLRYIPHKLFTVTRGRKRGITIYDVMSFFQTTMIGACNGYIPNDEEILTVESGKALRGAFTPEQLDSVVVPYWRLEGDLLVRLMCALRGSMVGAGIHLTAWYGPGAIAESLIKRESIAGHIQNTRTESPVCVTDATAYAYFGGRFETFMIGRIPGPIYSYDIRSAYPAALSQCPMLDGGEWVHVVRPSDDVDVWGLYRVTCHGHPDKNDPLQMGPFPNRLRSGVVTFGFRGEGWYYGHEVKAALLTGWDVTIHEGWRYESPDSTSAFTFLHELYLQRADWKRAGNPAQLAAKLGINSIYGKLAQLTGWDEENNLPPKYHQQWYAGQATSWCRARIWVAMSAADAIVACETDGIYSLSPLPVRLGDHLGEWEEEIYDEVIYVQSGVYFMRQGDQWKAKLRGLSGNVGVADVLRNLDTLTPIHTSVTRYGSLTGYIGRDNHHKWFKEDRSLVWGGTGKRRHVPSECPRCVDGHGPHRTGMVYPFSEFSHPRNLPWVTGDDTDWQMSDEDPLELIH